MIGTRQLPRAVFGFWLRTGQLPPVEYKFNGWHDPEDGRFTFVGNGRYFPPGNSSPARPEQIAMARPPKTSKGPRDNRFTGGGGSFGGGGATGPSWETPQERNAREALRRHAGAPPSPGSQRSNYVVRRGDTLSAIVKLTGVTVAQLRAANSIENPDRIEAGQKLTIPAKVERHPGWVAVKEKSLTFRLDLTGRTQDVVGLLSQSATVRSRRLQSDAGKPDRRTTDDGGHFIAPRFGGPKEAYNHFAQDANFNRGAYRTMEEIWAKAQRESKDVYVRIDVRYPDDERRPSRLKIEWVINGKRDSRDFGNEKGGGGE
jgi:LysM repeat protein